MPAAVDGAVVVEVLGQPQRLLVGVRRQRGRAAVGVDHEQVPGVGPDVEDAQTHGVNGTAEGDRTYADPVPEVDLVFPRAWVEFANPADESARCSAAT